MGPERALVSAEDVQIYAAGLSRERALRLEVDAERAIGGQAERAGEGAALGLLRLRRRPQGPGGPDVEVEVEEVTGVGEAGGMQLAALPLAGPL